MEVLEAPMEAPMAPMEAPMEVTEGQMEAPEMDALESRTEACAQMQAPI